MKQKKIMIPLAAIVLTALLLFAASLGLSSLENKYIAFSEPTCCICTSIVLSCMMLLSPIQSMNQKATHLGQ